MYSVSDKYLSAIRARTRTDSLTGVISLRDGTKINISNQNIESGSVSIERSCITGEELTFGEVILSELRIGVRTDLSRYLFYNGWISLTYGLLLEDETWEEIPLGLFLIGEAERKNDVISIIGYDNLIEFDDDYTGEVLYGTPYDILTIIGDKFGMGLSNPKYQMNNFPNGEEVIQIDETSGCRTYRDCIKLVCQMIGCFAVSNRNNRLEVIPFGKTSVETISLSERFETTASDFEVNYVGLTIQSTKKDWTAYTSSEETGLEMTIQDAPAWDYGTDETLQARTDTLMAELAKIRYTPCSLTMVADPRFDCGDMVTIPLKDGTEIKSIITKISWQYMGKMSIESIGRNPLLYGMKPKKASSIRKLESQTEENKLIFYSFTNEEAVTAYGADEKQISQVFFVTTKATSAMFIAQLPLTVEAEDTVTDSKTQTEKTVTVKTTSGASATLQDPDGNAVTLTVLDTDTIRTVERGYVDIQVEYYLQGELVDYEAVQRLPAGKHLLGLFYTFESLAGNANYQWQVKLKIIGGKGTATVPKRGFRATITGQGMAGIGAWDGTITADESASFTITRRENYYLTGIAETVEANTDYPVNGGTIEEVTSGFTIRKPAVTLTGLEFRVSVGETILQNSVSDWEYNQRYVTQDGSNTVLQNTWTYESSEQTIDSGRMSVVKGITNDLSSVEEVTVGG